MDVERCFRLEQVVGGFEYPGERVRVEESSVGDRV
jgi:hypothetical protein